MTQLAERPSIPPARARSRHPLEAHATAEPLWAYAGVVVAGLLLLGVVGEFGYLAATAGLAVLLFGGIAVARPAQRSALVHLAVDRADLLVIAITYLVVIGMYRVAFGVIEDQDLLLFAFFGGGMLVGVAVPVIYSVWGRRRSLATLGLSGEQLPRVAAVALLFAATQFAVTFWGYGDFPDTQSIITLLAMALVVGIFETIFFRGFVQTRLERSFGVAPAVFGTALLYGAYHVGYGMNLDEMVFLIGLGIIYAIAYATINNFLVMWPLLTPLGSFFAQLEGGELVGRLPWAALMGIADVVALMATLLWFARKHLKKLDRPVPGAH